MWKIYYLIRYGLWKGDQDKGDERKEKEDRKEYKPGAAKAEKKVRNVHVI
jgi:hypothetical protein